MHRAENLISGRKPGPGKTHLGMGFGRWKTNQLMQLAVLRRRFERLLRAASFPLEGEPSPQDDYALWQYYRFQEEEVKHTSPSPFSFFYQADTFLIAFSSSFLVAHASGILTYLINIMQKIAPH